MRCLTRCPVLAGLFIVLRCGTALGQPGAAMTADWDIGFALGGWVPPGGPFVPDASIRVGFPTTRRSQFELVLSTPLTSFPESGERTVFYSLQGKTVFRRSRDGGQFSLTWGAMGYYARGRYDSFFAPPIVAFLGVAFDSNNRSMRMRLDGQYVLFPFENGVSATRMSVGASVFR